MIDILISIIAKHFDVSESEIKPDTDIVEEYSPDSLDIMEIVIEFEKSCNKHIPDELIADTRTPAELVAIAK